MVDGEYLGTMVFVTRIEPPQDVRHRQENTKAYINCQALDTGSLLIAESCLAWVTTSGMGFSVEYPAITMHAISRDLSRFPEECLCVILDNTLGPEVDGSGESSATESSATELRFAPEDTSALTSMFQVMSACQRLHPDLEVDDDEEDAEDENESDLDLMPEDDQVIFQCSEPAIQYEHSNGAGDVQHLEAAVGQLMSNGGTHHTDMEVPSDNEDQFEDAECDH